MSKRIPKPKLCTCDHEFLLHNFNVQTIDECKVKGCSCKKFKDPSGEIKNKKPEDERFVKEGDKFKTSKGIIGEVKEALTQEKFNVKFEASTGKFFYRKVPRKYFDKQKVEWLE